MKRFITALGLVGLSLGLAVPMFADDKLGKDDKAACRKACGCESVAIDKPFNEVVGRVPEALKGAGLILAAEIDWAKLGTGTKTFAPQGMPGETPKLDPKTTDVRTFLIADDYLVNEVRTCPEHALWIGKMVVFDKDGKTELFYIKPSLKMEELKKSGIVPADKIADHQKKCEDYERRLEQAVNTLKGTK